jgi:hypothetical protein
MRRTECAWPFASLLLALSSLFLAFGCGGTHPAELGDGNGTYVNNTIAGTPCLPEGASRPCHVALGTHDGIVSCFQGTQACTGGQWGACQGAGSVTGQSLRGARLESAGGLRLESLSTPVGCSNDPCDPTCQTYNETPDAGIVPDGSTVVVAITGGSLASSNVPSGFQNKGNDPSGVCSTCPVGSSSLSCQQACQFDMQCNTNGTNGCTAIPAGTSNACAGIDITVPVTCENSNGTVEVSVCNRGTVAAPPGVNCYTYPGGSPQYPNSNPGLGTPVMTTATTIQPGACESQQVPGSTFPSGGTESLMCNPPNNVTTTTTAGPNYPDVTPTAGAWVTAENTYAADGVDSTLPMTDSTQTSSFSSASNNVGWTNAGNMMSTSADGVYATAAVTALANNVTVSRLPTSNAVQSGTWLTPAKAYSSTDLGDSATTTLALPATVTVPAVSGLGATTTSADSCNGSTGSACIWKSGANSDARNAEGAMDGAYTTATLSKGDDAVAFLGGYPFTGANAVPSAAVVTQITATVTWKQSVVSNRYTGGIGIYAGNGTTLIGSECSSNSLTTIATTMACSVTAAQIQSAGLAVSDLTSAQFVRIHGNHSSAGSVSSYSISVDSVTVSVQYQVPNTSSILYSGFGLNVANSIPSASTINSLTVTVNMKGNPSNSFAHVTFQPYKNGQATPIGAVPASVNPSTSLAQYVTTPSVAGLTPADLTDANFGVLVSASAATAAWILSVDYIQVTVNYSDSAGSNQTITLNGFGFDNTVPSGAIIEAVTTEVRWKTDVTSTFETLGIEAVAGGVVLGSELTTPAAGPPTSATTVSYTVTSGVTASQLYDANSFRVKLRATSAGGSNFNASVDYVKVTVTWAMTLTSTMSLGNFGLNIPSTATITGLAVAAKWSVSASNTSAQLGLQAFTSGTAIDTEATTPTGSSPPTADAAFTATPSIAGLTPASFADGTFTVNVRAARAAGSTPVTARVDYVTVTVTYTTTANLQIPECNYNNDWSVSKQNPALACQNVLTGGYATRTYTQTYASSCPAGTRTQWGYLAYDATTPSDASGSSDVKFQVNTIPSPADGGTGMPTAWVTAANTPAAGDPALCPVSGPSPCPKDLYAALGGLPAARNQGLTLQVTLTPSPDSLVAPTLNSWQITYSCPASE